MNGRRILALAAAALLVAAAATWVSWRAAPAPGASQPAVLASLADSIDAVTEVRLSRGDGSATTLRRRDRGWIVAQRNYPADPARLRALLIGLSSLHVIEQKTSDPSRYAALDVEDADGAQSRSLRIDVVADARSWSLLLGKAYQTNGCFVRVSGGRTALLAQPRIDADPQPARWIDPAIVDLAAGRVREVTVQPLQGPSYSLVRPARDAADLTLRTVPAGRKPAAAAVLDAVAGALGRLSAEDVRPRAPGPLSRPGRASFRTFDGLRLDVEGEREGNDAWIRISANVDQSAPRAPEAKGAEANAGPGGAAGEKTADAKAPDQAAEAAAINARVRDVEFQVPAYQYDAIYRQLRDLLAPQVEGAGQDGTRRFHQESKK